LTSIYHTNKGWHFYSQKSKKPVGYYSSLAETMAVAYAEEWTSHNNGTLEQGDNACSDRGSS
tara:strand:- start:552 stop:737 length:186 start_codon:yes stop_codon:yes gene_type:complete